MVCYITCATTKKGATKLLMSQTYTILGIETSCDETAVAVVRLHVEGRGQVDKGAILSNQILSQIEQHAPYGGVVPELAARAHLTHLPALIRAALDESQCRLEDMDAIAATAGPGLIGGVLIGLTMGKALALAHNLPFIGINHLEAHALTTRLTDSTPFPYLLLLISGGHCQLLDVAGIGATTLYGTTRDDAVGEAFDKSAKLLGLGYPGGPAIEACAKHGNPIYNLPRPLLNNTALPYDFSFSGLKTALLRQAEKLQPLTQTHINDLAASLQGAIADCLASRASNAMVRFKTHHKTCPNPPFVMAGGVAANQFLRHRLAETAQAHGFHLVAPPVALCTDNAAMIAWAGAERFASKQFDEGGMAVPARARWAIS